MIISIDSWFLKLEEIHRFKTSTDSIKHFNLLFNTPLLQQALRPLTAVFPRLLFDIIHSFARLIQGVDTHTCSVVGLKMQSVVCVSTVFRNKFLNMNICL